MSLRVLKLPRSHLLVVAIAAIVPRLAVVAVEREKLLSAYTEKSDVFAQTFVSTGTYGFLPGHPSGYTQPLYSVLLIPLYWIFGRSWLVVGLAQTLIAALTALLVYVIGLRVVPRLALLAAVVATLNPYLIWHDVHVNREILDQLVLAGLTLTMLALIAAPSRRLALLAGVLLGLAILGNTRLVALPLVLAGYVLVRLPGRRVPAAALMVAAALVVVTPWVVRNRVVIGCATLTTDGRALWKANNADTYRTLARGGWIDDVYQPKSFPPTADDQARIFRKRHILVPVDECAQMRHFEHLTFVYWKKHPGEKAKLVVQSVGLLWEPRVHETSGRPGRGTWQDIARKYLEPVYIVPIYLLAAAGLFLVDSTFAVLVLLLVGYNTAAAAIFAGTTRYRVPFDFLLVLLGTVAIERLLSSSRYRRSTPSTAAADEN